MTMQGIDLRLVPRPLWGCSLSAMCTPRHWKAVTGSLAGQPEQCRFAGCPGYHSSRSLHGHERWRYERGEARLESIWWLCPTCHEVFHPGRAQAIGGDAGLQRVTQRYAERCGITESEAESAVQRAFEQYRNDSRTLRWKIDLDLVPQNLLPLRCKSGKRTLIADHHWIGDPFGVTSGSACGGRDL